MATIIIQGTKLENEKAIAFLREHYDVFKVNQIASKEKDAEHHITVIDAYAERFGKEGFTDEEIDKANLCCVSKEKRCADCPYRKEKNCAEKAHIDFATLVSRSLRNEVKANVTLEGK